MAYPYNHVTRSNGTILTASIYNTDHQNHIDHNIPEDIDDFSATATEMKINTDPGEVGTESLATSLSEELARIRFIIKEITGKTEWYESPANNLGNFASGLLATFTNKTGGTVNAGDVVAIDTANDTAVALVDTLASTRRFVVALETILNNAAGRFSVFGLVGALAQGAITRGNWVYKSATTKAVADTGVASTSAAPTGAIGIATVAGVNATVGNILLVGPNTTASVGLANNSAVVARNVANSAVIELLKLDASDRATLGPGGTANVVIAGQARHDTNANDRFVLPVGADKWAT
jgi:hypothetical protein